MAHKGHPKCEFTSKAACEQARKEAIGRCNAMVGDKDPKECGNWAMTKEGDFGYCGVHIGVLARQLEGTWAERRIAEKKEELQRRIDEYIAFSQTHPSVWDRMATT